MRKEKLTKNQAAAAQSEDWLEAVQRSVVAFKTSHQLPELISCLEGKLAELEDASNSLSISSENRAKLHNELGLAYLYKDETDKAEEEFTRALAQYPQHVSALFNKGNLLLSTKRPGEALAFFNMIDGLIPGHAGSAYHAGLCHLSLEAPEKALACFRRTADLDPDSVGANYWAGELLLQSKQYLDATPYFKKACEINPELDDAKRGLAICKLKIGAFQEAVQLCDELIAHNGEAQYFASQIKGDAHLGLGQIIEGALSHVQMALLDYDARQYPVERAKELAGKDPEAAKLYADCISSMVPEMLPAFKEALDGTKTGYPQPGNCPQKIAQPLNQHAQPRELLPMADQIIKNPRN